MRLQTIGALALIGLNCGSGAKQRLTVADSLTTARALTASSSWWQSDGQFHHAPDQSVFISPDGSRYELLVVRGDLQNNGNSIDVISGDLSSVDTAAEPQHVATLFMTSLGTQFGGGTSGLTFSPSLNHIVWNDSERFSFLWGSEKNISQIYSVNVKDHHVEQLTDHPTDIVSYVVSRDGDIVYSAIAEHSRATSAELIRKGFAVTNIDLYSAIAGDADGYGLYNWLGGNDIFVQTRSRPKARKVALNGIGLNRSWTRRMSFAPSGRLVIVEGSPALFPPEWDNYTEPYLQTSIRELRRGGPDMPEARSIKQLFLVDTEQATAHPLWGAPSDPDHEILSWSPDGKSVVLAPTFLPARDADQAGFAGRAVAEVDVATGQYRRLPIAAEALSTGVTEVRWKGNNMLGINLRNGMTRVFRKRFGRWSETNSVIREESRKTTVPVRMELRQDLHTPPKLFAVDTRTGREKMAFDLNPGLLDKFSLGRVESTKWADKFGRSWSGLLYYPVDFKPGHQFPLVIQTHGHAGTSEFSLNGRKRGLGPSSAVFAAQPLANRNIAVLQIEDKDIPGIVLTPAEADMYVAGYEAAVEQLVASGLVDRSKVGLTGFSRTGWHVEYALTHSDFAYAAAVVCSNTDPSYLWASALAWSAESSQDIGAPPFGEGLRAWMERSPGFNADRLHTPLQLQSDGFGIPSILSYWEMFSRLRFLRQPVELYVVPDVEHGSHSMQNPRQLLASQERAVDWFDFWLNGHEEPALDKADQYTGWRALRALRVRDAATP